MYRRLIILTLGIFFSLAAGSVLVYPNYTPYLRSKFNLSLATVSLFGTCVNIGTWVCFFTGYFYDKYGSRISTILSFVLLPGGFFLMLLIISGNTSEGCSVVFLLVVGIILGQGSSLTYINTVNTVLDSFSPENHGLLIGILVSNVAMSPSIFTSFKDSFTDLLAREFVSFIFFFNLVVFILGIFLFDKISPKELEKEKEDKMRLIFLRRKETFLVRIIAVVNITTLLLYVLLLCANKSSNVYYVDYFVYPFSQFVFVLMILLERFKVIDLFMPTYSMKLIGENGAPVIGVNDINNIKNENENNIKVLNNIIKQAEENQNGQSSNKNRNEKDFEMKENSQESTPRKANIHDDLEDSAQKRANSNPNRLEKSPYSEERNSINLIPKKEYNQENDPDFQVQEYFMFSDKNKNKNKASTVYNSKIKKDLMKSINNSYLQSERASNPETNVLNNDVQIMIKYVGRKEIRDILKRRKEIDNTINETLRVLKIITNPELIIIGAVLLLIMGSMVSNLNNMQYIIEAAYEESAETTEEDYSLYINMTNNYSTVYFCFNGIARVCCSLVLGFIVKDIKFFSFFFMVTVLGLASQIIGVSMSTTALYISVALGGLTHGSAMTWVVFYVKNYFDTSDFGSVYGFLVTGNAIGALLIGTVIFPSFYYYYKESSVLSNRQCIGDRCFSGGYFLNCLMCISAAVLAFKLCKIKNNGGFEKRVKPIQPNLNREENAQNLTTTEFGLMQPL